MNAKKAKILRKLANESVKGTDSISSESLYIEIENRRKVSEWLDEDLIKRSNVVALGQLILSPASKKGIIRQFKKTLKNSNGWEVK